MARQDIHVVMRRGAFLQDVHQVAARRVARGDQRLALRRGDGRHVYQGLVASPVRQEKPARRGRARPVATRAVRVEHLRLYGGEQAGVDRPGVDVDRVRRLLGDGLVEAGSLVTPPKVSDTEPSLAMPRPFASWA